MTRRTLEEIKSLCEKAVDDATRMEGAGQYIACACVLSLAIGAIQAKVEKALLEWQRCTFCGSMVPPNAMHECRTTPHERTIADQAERIRQLNDCIITLQEYGKKQEAKIRREALEEAAKVCGKYTWAIAAKFAIRALIDKGTEKPWNGLMMGREK